MLNRNSKFSLSLIQLVSYLQIKSMFQGPWFINVVSREDGRSANRPGSAFLLLSGIERESWLSR